jgi:hypothetical protein
MPTSTISAGHPRIVIRIAVPCASPWRTSSLSKPMLALIFKNDNGEFFFMPLSDWAFLCCGPSSIASCSEVLPEFQSHILPFCALA